MATPLPLRRSYPHRRGKEVTGAVGPGEGGQQGESTLQLPGIPWRSFQSWVSGSPGEAGELENAVGQLQMQSVSDRLGGDGWAPPGHKACLGTQVWRELPSRTKLARPQNAMTF